jgi:magnesium chelatase family protein
LPAIQRATAIAGRAASRIIRGPLSGPLLDRINLQFHVAAVSAADMTLPPPAEGSAEMAERVAAARARQNARGVWSNA